MSVKEDQVFFLPSMEEDRAGKELIANATKLNFDSMSRLMVTGVKLGATTPMLPANHHFTQNNIFDIKKVKKDMMKIFIPSTNRHDFSSEASSFEEFASEVKAELNIEGDHNAIVSQISGSLSAELKLNRSGGKKLWMKRMGTSIEVGTYATDTNKLVSMMTDEAKERFQSMESYVDAQRLVADYGIGFVGRGYFGGQYWASAAMEQTWWASETQFGLAFEAGYKNKMTKVEASGSFDLTLKGSGNESTSKAQSYFVGGNPNAEDVAAWRNSIWEDAESLDLVRYSVLPLHLIMRKIGVMEGKIKMLKKAEKEAYDNHEDNLVDWDKKYNVDPSPPRNILTHVLDIHTRNVDNLKLINLAGNLFNEAIYSEGIDYVNVLVYQNTSNAIINDNHDILVEKNFDVTFPIFGITVPYTACMAFKGQKFRATFYDTTYFVKGKYSARGGKGLPTVITFE